MKNVHQMIIFSLVKHQLIDNHLMNNKFRFLKKNSMLLNVQTPHWSSEDFEQ